MVNTSHTSDADLYYNRDRPSITSLIKPGPHRILDLGCGSGAVGKKLLDSGKAAEMVGVEIFEDAGAQARKIYSRVFTGDIEQMELPFSSEFDYVLCGDILEHLKDPYSVVGRIYQWLKPQGELICSLPNVRYWPVLADLAFKGAWSYADAGVMDKTHLRFFTRRSAVEMLHNSRFQVKSCRMMFWGRKFKILDAVSFGLFQEFLGPQMVLHASKNGDLASP